MLEPSGIAGILKIWVAAPKSGTPMKSIVDSIAPQLEFCNDSA